jgi:hypothetical protein
LLANVGILSRSGQLSKFRGLPGRAGGSLDWSGFWSDRIFDVCLRDFHNIASRRLARRECIEETLSILDFHNVLQPDRSFSRLIRLTRVVATLALFAVVSGTFACREAGEPSRAATGETLVSTSALSTKTSSVRFAGGAGGAKTRAGVEPTRSSVGEAGDASAPSTPPAGLASVDSDAYVALDPDSEIKASEIANDASRLEAGSSGDSIGQAAADSDAYALSRE